MPIGRLFEVFQQLPQATAADSFTAAKAPDLPNVWITRDHGDRPQILIEVRSELSCRARRVALLEFDPCRDCTIEAWYGVKARKSFADQVYRC